MSINEKAKDYIDKILYEEKLSSYTDKYMQYKYMISVENITKVNYFDFNLYLFFIIFLAQKIITKF